MAQQKLLDTAAAQVPSLDDPSAQNVFVAALAALFPKTTSEPDPGLDDGTGTLVGNNGAAVLQNILTQLGVTGLHQPGAVERR